MHQVIHECALFDIVNVSVLAFNLHKQIALKKDCKNLRLRKAILKDNTGKISGVSFESKIDEISEEACYNLTKIRFQKYQDESV